MQEKKAMIFLFYFNPNSCNKKCFLFSFLCHSFLNPFFHLPRSIKLAPEWSMQKLFYIFFSFFHFFMGKMSVNFFFLSQKMSMNWFYLWWENLFPFSHFSSYSNKTKYEENIYCFFLFTLPTNRTPDEIALR